MVPMIRCTERDEGFSASTSTGGPLWDTLCGERDTYGREMMF